MFDQQIILGQLIDAAVDNQNLADELLAKHPELKNTRWRLGETALHFLAVEGFVQAVEFLGTRGFDVNATNEVGDNALSDVVTQANDEMVAALLDLGANPNFSSPNRGPILFAAICSTSESITEKLLKAGATIEKDSVWEVMLRGRLIDQSPAMEMVLQRFGFSVRED